MSLQDNILKLKVSLDDVDLASCDVMFFQPLSVIDIDINSTKEHEPGLIAGSEGLGCEFFFDETKALYFVALSLPFEVVDIPPADPLNAAISTIGLMAEPGTLYLDHWIKTPLNPFAVWMTQVFGTALLSFGMIPLQPAEAFTHSCEQLICVKVCEGFTVCVNKTTGSLELILIQNFNSKQELYNHDLTDHSYSVDFTHALDEINLAFYGDYEISIFESLTTKILNNFNNAVGSKRYERYDEEKDILSQLVEQYTEDLRNFSE